MTTPSDEQASTIAMALAPLVEMWRTLLATHVPDREGRCTACRWQTRSADPWPCTVYDVAAAAQQVASRRRAGADPAPP
ncbi:MAG: hypothetical protein ACRDXB_11870 [Actinomycetes bacterium]